MVAFAAVIAVGLAVFARTLWKRWEILTIGKPEDRFSNPGARIANMLRVAIFQSKILNEFQAGIMHALIFWGFCVVSLNTTIFVAEGFSNELLPKVLHAVGLGSGQVMGNLYAVSKDVFEVLVIVGLAIAFYRRLVLRPDRLTYSFEANLILLFIFVLMVSDFFMFGIKLNSRELPAEFAKYIPVSAAFGSFVKGWSQGAQHTFYAVNFWVHLVVLFTFLNMLPLSKHFHVITSIPNTYFASLEPKGRLSKMNLEDENATSFGTGQFADLSWKNIFDTYTCTECGRCQTVCPAYETKKPLSDKEINQNIKHALYDHAAALLDAKRRPAGEAAGGAGEGGGEGGDGQPAVPTLNGEVVKEETLWACTTCRWCDEACPVTIENVPRIVDMRRYLVLTESKFPKELTAVFKGLENQSNPWGIGSNKRQDWAEGMEGLKWASENPDFEYLYWVGCAGSFDDRNKKVTLAMLKILDAAGVKYAMLGNEEGCCGDSARRLGNEYLFQSLVQANVEIFNTYKVKKIITTCPHGYNTFKNEYPQFGGNYEVFHHTELIAQWIGDGKLKLANAVEGACTYHDSCFLGRYNEVYEPPRDILKAVPGVGLKEMPQNRMRSFCCGAGGGRMWLEETIGERINRKRTAEALSVLSGDATLKVPPEPPARSGEMNRPALAGPDGHIATACPFCLIMLDDGVKDKGVEEKVKTLDIAEIVARSLA
ncbi:MAG: 4Fe-4S dicluster domain-containing protein [Deltaproteobacteria bacterium]|nr:4Fe-4S dicluster domain-containing protein [Deltaproteobacteria bacterium]